METEELKTQLEAFGQWRQDLIEQISAYQEWLECMPSDRIMWGADCTTPEGIYGATVFTRQCLAEALAEKVERGELLEEHAIRIGRQIMRGNALQLFPRLRRMLWR